MDAIVEVKGLTKRYGDLVAVGEVSFEIEKGEIFGLFGSQRGGQDHNSGDDRGLEEA